MAINDPGMTPEQMAYYFKHDSTHGIYGGCVQVSGDCLVIDDNSVKTSKEKSPESLKWKSSDVEYVVECTGKFLNIESAKGHIAGGAKRVIISAPSPDAPMFVIGVNHDCYDNKMKIISMASCTTNCLAPVMKVAHENFEIEYALGVTVHAVTASQPILDMGKKKLRSGRSGMMNIIPATTGASKALVKVYPALKDKINLYALRVPTCNVSLISMSCK